MKSQEVTTYDQRIKNREGKTVESSVNINNLLPNKCPISMFDLKRRLIAIVFAYFFKNLVYYR